MSVMVVLTVVVLMVTCVVLVVSVALLDQQRDALIAASARLQRAIDGRAPRPAARRSRTDGTSR